MLPYFTNNMKIIWNFHAKMHPRIRGAFFVFPVSFFFMRLTAVGEKKMHKTPCNIVRQACYSGLFQLVDSRSYVVKLAQSLVLLLGTAGLCSRRSDICLGSPLVCSIR